MYTCIYCYISVTVAYFFKPWTKGFCIKTGLHSSNSSLTFCKSQGLVFYGLMDVGSKNIYRETSETQIRVCILQISFVQTPSMLVNNNT